MYGGRTHTTVNQRNRSNLHQARVQFLIEQCLITQASIGVFNLVNCTENSRVFRAKKAPSTSTLTVITPNTVTKYEDFRELGAEDSWAYEGRSNRGVEKTT